MVKNYAKIAEEMPKKPFFRQRILTCPEIKLEGKVYQDKIFKRSDPFGNHSVRISITRSLRPKNIEEIVAQNSASSRESCIFCPENILNKMAEPRIVHAPISPGEFTPITAYNPFGVDGISMVSVFTYHKEKLKELTFYDMEAYMETLYETALYLKEKHQAKGMWEFINWGPLAGASQEHFHVQRGATPEDPVEDTEEKEDLRKNTIQIEMERTQKLTKRFKGKDPFELYLTEIRNSPYFIWESQDSDGLFIFAPPAPEYPHEVEVIPKQKIDTVLKLNDKWQRMRMSRSMLGVFQALEEKLGVTDLNVALHQGLFDEENGNYRLHWHFYPRNFNRWGGMEAGQGVIVLPFFPEETADILYQHYHHRER